MNKICTSLEQSKKFIELGIDRKTSDLYYWCRSDLRIGGYRAQDEELDIPAWSLTALLGLIPNSINFGYENDSIFILKKIENERLIKSYSPIWSSEGKYKVEAYKEVLDIIKKRNKL